MTITSPTEGETRKPKFVDKAAMMPLLNEQLAKAGFVLDPTATPEKAQEMTRGREKENLLSRSIIEAREE